MKKSMRRMPVLSVVLTSKFPTANIFFVTEMILSTSDLVEYAGCLDIWSKLPEEDEEYRPTINDKERFKEMV